MTELFDSESIYIVYTRSSKYYTSLKAFADLDQAKKQQAEERESYVDVRLVEYYRVTEH